MTKRTVCTQLLIGGIRVGVDSAEQEILNKARDKMKRAGIPTSTLHFRLYKKSVDARRREDIRFVCTVLAEGELPEKALAATVLSRADARILKRETLAPVIGEHPLAYPPMVVGMGPAGLFAALLLARYGYAPILIDRGASVEDRVRDVARFTAEGALDPDSNIQFGAGGAGTFSDGKLITRIQDPYCSLVLETLVEFGAPKEILFKAKPHVGTDLLRGVVSAMLREIERLGGQLRYRCRLDDIVECADGICAVTSQGDVPCGALILAPGHSARDTYRTLIRKSYAVEAKPFSVGVRVEHLQAEIDEALYGRLAGHPALGPAEYALSDTTGERGVYTFCMCPGGEVVAAASEAGGLVVNGMSHHARDGRNANSAVAVSIRPEDIAPIEGSIPLGAIEYQRKIERAAFLAGGGDYRAPIMTMGDFLEGKRGTAPQRILPTYRGGAVTPADFSAILPEYVLTTLRRGFLSFDRKLAGFACRDAVLTAPETRTSAPLRILRDPSTLTGIGHSLVYPAGEGAGYAGGITSAAVDGLRSAMALMAAHAPKTPG